MPLAWLSVLSLTLLAVLTHYSLRESRMADSETHMSRAPVILLAALSSAILICGWAFQQ